MTETNPSETDSPREDQNAEDDSTNQSPPETVLTPATTSAGNTFEPEEDENEANSVDRDDSASLFSTTTTTTRSKSPNTRKLNRLCRRAKAPKTVPPLYKYR